MAQQAIARQAAIAAFTIGQIPFPDTNGLLTQDAKLFWDATNHRLGINQATPTKDLDIVGSAKVSVSVITALLAAVADGVTGIKITKADGTSVVMDIDTTNTRVGIGNSAPTVEMDVTGSIKSSVQVITPIVAALADAVTGIKITKANGVTVVLDVDTTNSRIGINNSAPTKDLDVTGVIKASTSVIAPVHAPAADGTTAILLTKADGTTAVLTVDTTNSRLGVGGITPSYTLDVNGAFRSKTVVGTSPTVLTPGASVSVDPTLNDTFTLTPGQAETINAASVPPGQVIYIVITTSGVTSYNLTFSTNFKSQGVLATGTTTGKVFVVTFVSDGVNFNEVSRTTAM